jgi:hypothetical protein
MIDRVKVHRVRIPQAGLDIELLRLIPNPATV